MWSKSELSFKLQHRRYRQTGIAPDEVPICGFSGLGCVSEEVIQQLDNILEGVSEDAAHVAEHIHSGSASQLLHYQT